MTKIKPLLLLFTVAFVLRLGSLMLSSHFLGLTLTQIASFQDGPSYIFLATSWPPYPGPHSVIHFPFYPMVIRIFALFMPAQQAALIVSLLAGGVAVVLYGQVLRRYSEQWFEIALIFSVFPFRWFNISQLAMSEALFLMLLLLSFLFFEKERFFLSGCCLGLSWLTRLSGIFLFPVFLYKAYESRKQPQRNLLWLTPACGLLAAFGIYLYCRFGSFAIYFQEHNRMWMGATSLIHSPLMSAGF